MGHAHTSKDLELAAKKRFDADTDEHQMTVLHDDGLYRHLRFAKPGSSFYWFEVITWPGHLTLNGDMGSWTFARTQDMFEFFRDGRGLTRINPGYWAEKLLGGLTRGQDLAAEYDGDLYVQIVNERINEFFEHGRGTEWPADVQAELREQVKEVFEDDYGNNPPANQTFAIEAATRFRFRATRKAAAPPAMTNALGGGMVGKTYEFDFSEPYEWGLTSYSIFFLWACWAIVHAITAYDAHKATEEPKDEVLAAALMDQGFDEDEAWRAVETMLGRAGSRP